MGSGLLDPGMVTLGFPVEISHMFDGSGLVVTKLSKQMVGSRITETPTHSCGSLINLDQLPNLELLGPTL
jgi:hypothetical protein